MRKLLLSVLVVAAVGTVTWALWPATTWPTAFCKPINRVVGKDAIAIVNYVALHREANTPASASLRDALLKDVVLAERHAPTTQLRQELSHYAYELNKTPTESQTTDSMSNFDGLVHRDLRACGITPLGR